MRRNDNKRVYYCYDCERNGFKQKLFIINGTTGAREYMARVHRRNPDTGIEAEALPKALPKAQQSSFFELVDRKDYDVFKALLFRWIVLCQLAFFMLENTLFRDLIQYLNTSLAALLPKARSTLRTWILSESWAQKSKIVKELKSSRSRVHISFDIWDCTELYHHYQRMGVLARPIWPAPAQIARIPKDLWLSLWREPSRRIVGGDKGV